MSANADELITAMTAPNKNKRFVFFISIIHPAIQLFSYSAIQLFSYSAIQLFSYSAIQLFSYSAIQLFSYSAIQLFSYSAIQLFSQIKHYLLQFSGNKP
ncbi:hypothetical protein AH861_004536 [Salmonella enterica subsp. enterica serovar Minnesota]|nr:hypothetical protein [Salmonella enterica subsp. enterica serovar Minnesota]